MQVMQCDYKMQDMQCDLKCNLSSVILNAIYALWS